MRSNFEGIPRHACSRRSLTAATATPLYKSMMGVLAILCLLSTTTVKAWSSTSQPTAWSLADRLMGRRPTLRSTTRRYLSKNDKNAGRPSTKQHQKEMLEFIDQPMESTVGDGASLSMDSQQQQEILDLVYCIAKAADGRKAENIVALHVHPVSTLTSYLVILSGNSRPQNQAIAAAITKDVQEQFDLRPGGSKGVPEGTADSGWMLLDYGTVMVHIMTPKSRLYYNVEGQWKDKGGVALDLSHVLIPNSALSAEAGFTPQAEEVPEEEDPFWS